MGAIIIFIFLLIVEYAFYVKQRSTIADLLLGMLVVFVNIFSVAYLELAFILESASYTTILLHAYLFQVGGQASQKSTEAIGSAWQSRI